MHPNLTTKPSYPECSDLLLEIKSDTSDTNSEIADTSDNNCTITKIGDVKHTTDIKIQSSSSINFDGDNDILHIEDEISLDGDFTFEAGSIQAKFMFLTISHFTQNCKAHL